MKAMFNFSWCVTPLTSSSATTGDSCANSYEHLNGGRPRGGSTGPCQEASRRDIELFTTTRGLFPNLRGLETGRYQFSQRHPGTPEKPE